MRNLPLAVLALAAAVFSPLAHASSSIRNPIGALSVVRNATIHTHLHRVTAVSEFELSFRIRDGLDVKLSLHPNHDILPADATISHLAADGTVSRSEPVDRLAHRVFKGTAWVARPDDDAPHRWRNVGWARIFVRRDGKVPFFEGAFSLQRDHHHIQSSANYLRTKHNLDPEIGEHEDGEEFMVVWRDSDILPTAAPSEHRELRRAATDVSTCQADVLSFNSRPDHPVYLGMMQPPPPSRRMTRRDIGAMDFSNVFRRQIDSTTGGNSGGVDLTSTIGQTSGCPSTRKVALVGVATDCGYTGDFNSTQTMRENVITQMNTASAVWEGAFNISLGLQNLTVSDASCPGTPAPATAWNQPCSNNLDIQGRLNFFSEWRGTQADDNSHWTLLSTCNTGSAVGLAWLGQACVNTAMTANVSVTGNGATSGDGTETVSGANVVVRAAGTNEWQIIAHETGHTYGAVHDCTDTTCADKNFVNSQQCCPLSATTCDAGEQFIMNPSTALGITHFSLCSIGNICSAIGRNSVKTACLSDNKEVTTISGQQCGNGIVEPGEECDCGGDAGCGEDPCCEPTTCKFKPGAVCDDSNEDCCHGCQLATNGTVCRSSTGVCDPQEVCSGSSSSCPPDVTMPDGHGCGSGLQCASGQCTSRDEQCKSVMANFMEGNDMHACDSQSCVITCTGPGVGPDVCVGTHQNFLDGTTCGGDGKCVNGQCKGDSTGGQIRSWIDDHKAIVIGIASAIGALLLLAFLGCLGRCWTRRRNPPRPRRKGPPPPQPYTQGRGGPDGWQGWDPQQQQMAQNQHMYAAQGWWAPPPPPPHYQATTMSGGRGGWDTPPPPPPTFMRSGSVRYA